MIVLDTNVVSELMRPSRDPAVVTWLGQQTRGSLVTTAITVAEIRFGLARLPDGRRATELRQLADEVLGAFPGQVLPFNTAAAALYGDIAAARERGGRPVDALDAQIAAICRAHSASLATRNTRDFVGTGVELVDPWQA
ncbi:type II toxin-antitoxin system VapC family toxin [Geodermatophilus obscurus]|uniref:Ribonuclease VapC n=1 Tax=Geodermatophilus obscurus (strain ATCC 25078 / DSM 43160 / JCM 3152 / CCUG 61914 / KCC A-0152 / KCTC 9177 / NBRC 13315 / NRRL B-3577 / G-20) TaxID=526225 RepID=D2SCF2_GEOOG|nr:type II toxin-antitoxin system VapC family toxin [Geodermatophilus obscurus]ADB76280.1 PilT protein domain protein [Geodermatophilus obscurus DSM 43160]